MEIVVTIALLVVPVFSVVSFVLSLRAYSRTKAMKVLVSDLSKLIATTQQQPMNAVDAAMQNYRMQVL